MRARYGANHFGQSCLLARRLVEAGTRYVQIKWYHVAAFDAWDTHGADLPGLNTSRYDERRAALSGDGQWLAYTTNAPDGQGLTDVRLYRIPENKVVAVPEMNSPATESFPSLSGDGRLVCFASDRDGGEGRLDIYLYDQVAHFLVPLPGLNSPGHEQTPSIASDGRWIAFVSERFGSPGEHDIFLYDRQSSRLLETPGLNTVRDDFDPCLILLSTSPDAHR